MPRHLGGLVGGGICGLILGQELTLERPVYRWPRNILVLLFGGVITVAGMSLFAGPPDLSASIDGFFQLDEMVFARERELDREVSQNEITPDQRHNHRDLILTNMATSHADTAGPRNAPPQQTAVIASHRGLQLKRREEYWQVRLRPATQARGTSCRTPHPTNRPSLMCAAK